ncbi:MAG: restriction endonuclease [Christensenellales bacterium]
MLTLLLLERRTLARRDHALRVRVGGSIALEELMLLPAAQAEKRVCALLAQTLGGNARDSVLTYANKTYLVRCAQTLSGSSVGEGDVLAAHRARIASETEFCILASTGGFSPSAQRAAEWMEPPVRLIAGRQLALLFGQQPATDTEIARRARRRRTPFSAGAFPRWRSLGQAGALSARRVSADDALSAAALGAVARLGAGVGCAGDALRAGKSKGVSIMIIRRKSAAFRR